MISSQEPLDPVLDVPGADEPKPWNIVRVSHVDLTVADLEASRAFYVDLLGLVATEEADGALYLRGYEDSVHHALVLREGGDARVNHVSFRVWSPDCLRQLAARYDELGCETRWIAAGAERGQGEALRVQDPLGCTVEFFAEMEPAQSLLRRFDLYRGPHIMRLDHVNFQIPDVQAGFEYYRRLGFRCSEYTVADPPDGRMWAAWLYRKPGVHDVAFTNGTGPRLHHFAFWLAEPMGVIRACDILAGAERADMIERGPGRHGVSNAFFVYLRDPDGHRVELFTADYFTGDPDVKPLRWLLSDPRRQTFWGHAAPQSWFEESSPFADLDGEPVPLVESDLTALPTVLVTG